MANDRSVKECSPEMLAGRLAKAKSYLKAAGLIALSNGDLELHDAFITNCVYAGIAASDVICCSKLGRHSSGPNHKSAVALLRSVDSVSANHLDTLLNLKSGAGYSHVLSDEVERHRAEKAAAEIVKAAIGILR